MDLDPSGVDEVSLTELQSEDELQQFIINLIALDYDLEHKYALGRAYSTLTEGASQLIRCRDGPTEDALNSDTEGVGVTAFRSTANEGILMHDDLLMPAWRKFTKSLSSVKSWDKGYIHLMLKRIRLDQSVIDLLLQAFKTAPMKVLQLHYNYLGSDGLKFAAQVLEVNSKLICLDITGNLIDSEQDATFLVDSLLKHPTIDAVILDECNIGSNDAVVEAVLPALELGEVLLQNNGIGSYGARLISGSLALNPMVLVLDLEGNLLQDAEANMIARSLKSNTNLVMLRMSNNQFTERGLLHLLRAVAGLVSLDEIHSSNHTCFIEIKDNRDDGGWPLDLLSKTNIWMNPVMNKKIKILCAIISHDESYTNISTYFVDVPTKIMPRILHFLQGVGFMNETKHNRLDAVYRLIREWSMPLLYTNRVGPKSRRSERLRRRKVLQLMAK